MKKILIAEDNSDFAEVLKLALEASGYAVEVARNGSDAIASQVTFGADILITDLIMPERDGFETLDAFRKEFPQTRIVVVSGAQKLDPEKYLNAAKLIGVPPPPEIAFEEAGLSPMVRSFYEGSRRISNARIKSELGVKLRYPTYREGLASLLGKQTS